MFSKYAILILFILFMCNSCCKNNDHYFEENEKSMILLYDVDDIFSLVNEKGDTSTYKIITIEDKMVEVSGMLNYCTSYGQSINLKFENTDDNDLGGYIFGIKEIGDYFTYGIELILPNAYYDFSYQTSTTSVEDFSKLDNVKIDNIIYNDVYSIHRSYYNDSLESRIYFNDEFGIIKIEDTISYTAIY